MSEIEDYKAVFFQECDELLDDLEVRLDALATGDRDPETIHAAFRAVHSIKGGADAFGYQAMVSFSHAFEAAMDTIRSGRRSVEPEDCELLIRARDMLCELVERARNGDPATLPATAPVVEQLAEFSGVSAPEPAAPISSAPDQAESAEPGDATDYSEGDSFRIDFAPGPDFLFSGHDPLRLIQALRAYGALQVAVRGDIPALAELDPKNCPLSWDLTLQTERSPLEIERFFEIYRATAQIRITAPKAAATATAPAPAPPAGIGNDADPPSAIPATTSRALRVDLERVDRLVNMVGEIGIAQASMAQAVAENYSVDLAMLHATDAMSRQVSALQECVMAIRAQSVKGVFSRMGRLIRDLARQLDKEVRVEITGEGTEVDSTVIDELAEPLIHLIRNALDHGIELPDARTAAGKPRHGTISISARQKGARVIISIADDGRGIDRDRLFAKAVAGGVITANAALGPEEIDQLIFHPGLSTASAVSNVSGRGVGMDVVRRNIRAMGGRVNLDNSPGHGMRISITLPLSLAVLDGMTVSAGDQHFVLPMGAVLELMTLEDASAHSLPSGTQVMRRGEEFLPLVSLRRALEIAGQAPARQLVAVVDADEEGRFGLLVDALVGQRQVVLKSLEANYHGVPGISGATILGNGRAALILDVASLGSANTAGDSTAPWFSGSTPDRPVQGPCKEAYLQ